MPLALRDGRGSRAPRARRLARFQPACATLESRQLLSTGVAAAAPTDYEQYMLEEINRARANPPAEAQRLEAILQSDPTVQMSAQGSNLSQFIQFLNATPPLPPLAFNPRLIQAARDHDAVMLQQDNQVHSPSNYLTAPGGDADGQPYYPVGSSSWATGENIFAYSQVVSGRSLQQIVDYLEEGFEIDWGNPDLGHLLNLMAPGPNEAAATGRSPFSEIGIGLLTDANPTAPPASGVMVGPVIVTQEFAWHTGNAFLTGVAYNDAAGTGFYAPGEGLGGVTITAVGREGEGTFQAVTWGSGGYALPLPPGTYNVTASGNLPGPQTTTIAIGADNVGWDIRLPAGGQTPTAPPVTYPTVPSVPASPPPAPVAPAPTPAGITTQTSAPPVTVTPSVPTSWFHVGRFAYRPVSHRPVFHQRVAVRWAPHRW